jgi:hypothetical protein
MYLMHIATFLKVTGIYIFTEKMEEEHDWTFSMALNDSICRSIGMLIS